MSIGALVFVQYGATAERPALAGVGRVDAVKMHRGARWVHVVGQGFTRWYTVDNARLVKSETATFAAVS